ncbi:methyltransferase [Labedaea rhizosphaerae]|uniref:Flavoprotein n=1 Tax=Labedaea rhizosphaerae TaxID=598644 RepID=A0A4R6S0E1_LABRH|nr:methyltransferase [Labedaea rhizosphaerae]TDP92910.1 flavoprotein [Labedaea rhizosphaerae]
MSGDRPPRLLVGACGSISVVKLPAQLTALRALGADVKVVLTGSAASFLPVGTVRRFADVVTDDDHVSLARWADLFVVLPCTANTLAAIAQGLTPNSVSTIAIAHRRPLLLFPAMNADMWAAPSVTRNVETLRADGHTVIDPVPAPVYEVASGQVVDGIAPPPVDQVVALVRDRLRGTDSAAAVVAPRLQALIRGYRGTAVVGAAVRLELAEHLGDGELTAADLAGKLGAEPERLRPLLSALVHCGLLAVRDGRYRLTGDGLLLATPAVRTAALAANELAAPAHAHLADAVTGPVTAFERAFGTDVFSYLDADPGLAQVYGDAIATPGLIEAVARRRDHANKHVVDLGGGTGALMAEILRHHDTARGTVVDLPSTVDLARERLRAFGDRVACVAGDFREAVPRDGDLYLLCRVLANWTDDDATRVLERCRAAMPRHAVLYIVEMVRSTDDHDVSHAFGELELHATYGGRLRTVPQWNALLSAAGFAAPRAASLPGGWTILRVEAPDQQ